MVPKVNRKGLLSFVQKKIFFLKINHDRVANNVFDLQNDFHEDRLSFPVSWRKNKFGSLRLAKIFTKIRYRELKNWGIRKNRSRDDLLTDPQIPAYEVYPDNDSLKPPKNGN